MNIPYFEATCPFPHGWIQIQVRIARLDGQTPRRETAEIFADFGAGYAHSQPLERVDWCEKLDQSELYIYLPRPAIGLRVRPLEGPAIFTVEQFSAACVSTRKVLMLAIKRKVHLVRRSRRMSQSLLRAVELFLTGRWLGLWRRVFKALPDSVVTRPAADVLPELGNSWCRRKPLPDAERIRSMAEIEAIAAPPVLSLMLPVDEMPDALLRTIVESIRGQTYPHWQLVAHLSPRTPYPHPVLEPYAQSDVRIRVVAALTEDDPEGAWHDWLEAVETPYAVVINPGYELAETALHRLAIHLSANPATELVINRNAPALSSGHCPDREIRLFRTGDGGGQLNVFRIEDLRSLRNKPDFRSMPLGLELARQLVQRGNKASYLAESLTYHCATLAQVPIATSDDQRLLNQVGPKKASQSLMITGDIIGITGWDQLVFEIARGLHSIGFDVRLNHECAITTELLPPYMVPLIRRRTPQDRELTICSPYFLNHHKPLPGNAIFTMWEADEFEPEWIAILNRASRVFVPSQWGADCLRSAGVSTPVFVIPLGHDPLTFCADADLPDICTFGTAAALWGGGIRKNTQRLIELFQKAFPRRNRRSAARQGYFPLRNTRLR